MYKTRFCPSPTGLIHLGNARTALFNVLAAKDGCFLVRIEDTDKTRSYAEHTDALLSDMQWLGMDWQEGPNKDQGNGPYWQSERQSIYDTYYEQLIEQGKAYTCYCSDEELALNRKIQLANNQPPRYPGTCRKLSDDERQAKAAEGLQAVLRYHMHEDEVIEFTDHVKGKQTYRAGEIGDFIIRRADGSSPFMYANALDDSLMGVNLALRGEDHLTNTPRQLSLLRTLGLDEPTYGHISLILGKDGAPLSKRNGSKSVADLRAEGYLPIAVVNYLARLGHYYEDDSLMTMDDLKAKFELTNLSSSPARFDETQLNYWQKQAVLAASDDVLIDWIGEARLATVDNAQQNDYITLIRENCVFPSDIDAWHSALYADDFVNAELLQQLKAIADKSFFEAALAGFDAHGLDFKAMSQQVKDACGVKGKQLFMPFRLALSGFEHGPDLGSILNLIGEARVRARLDAIINQW